jgi:CarboxypepD_reg-like domain
MRISEKGRFCSNCTKNVMDFSALTDNQIIHLIENSNGKLCGRLNKNQVDRIMEIQNQHNFGTTIYKLLAGLLLFSSLDSLLAQSTIKNNQTVLRTDNVGKEYDSFITTTNNITTKDSLKNFIKGKVFDSETKEPLAGASIIIKGKNIGTTADMNGVFTFNIPENLITDQIVFNVLYVGFEPNEFIIYKKDLPMDKEFLMLPSTTSLMGEVCVTKTKRKWWQRKKKSS